MPALYPATVVATHYRQGLSYARGTGIDPYLDDAVVASLYEKWQPSWPTPYEFQGGIKEITCEMVLEVPQAALNKTFGTRVGLLLTDVARRYGGG